MTRGLAPQMRILFVHKNFPAQFGHVARRLVRDHGFECTFVSELPGGVFDGIRRLQYEARGGASGHGKYLSRSFENYVGHSVGVYEALKAHPEVQPDLIVGHSGFGSTLFLGDLYDCPIINYCEYYYHSRNSDLDFRPDFPPSEMSILRSRARNAALLLDLQNCAAAYSPTEWQRSRFPIEYRTKIETIYDGVDTNFWQPASRGGADDFRIAGRIIGPKTKVVTYVSRGFESMRGFDIFMKVAKNICDARQDVVFVCVGSDRICYGGDRSFINGGNFREWVLAQERFDLDRFVFTGRIPATELAALFQRTDLHIYLTVPFVLSWSLINALASGCTVLASDTDPVREVIVDGRNGLLASFYDVTRLTERALEVLDEPGAFRDLGRVARSIAVERYSIEANLPRMIALYRRVSQHYERSARAPAFATGANRALPALAGSIAPERMQTPNARLPEIALLEPDDSTETRVVVTVPHYFFPTSPNNRHGALRGDVAARVAAIRRCITALHELFAGVQYTTDLRGPDCRRANAATRCRLDIVVCTTRGRHLLKEASMPPSYFTHVQADCEGPMLGFECQWQLRERLGGYDFYCYMEDDLVLYDPMFFLKLRSFADHAGPLCLLQPHRYEGLHAGSARKAYVDGELPLAATEHYQNISDQPEIRFRYLSQDIACRRASNPHAGCFFLAAEQMRHWANEPYFLDGDISFYGPLESAATLGIMKAFRTYKPETRMANFFEIQHYGAAILRRLAARRFPTVRSSGK